MNEKMLITIDQVNPVEIFVNGKYDNLLKFIRKESEIKKPDVKTKKGRDLIKSMAARVTSSKVFIIKGGKDLADAEKKKIADALEAMNTSKKFIEDCLVYRKAEVREPLTKWEEAKKSEEAAAALEVKKQNDHTEAIEHNKFLDDQKALKEKEKQIEKDRIQLEADTKAIKTAGYVHSEAVNTAVKSQGAAEAEVKRLEQKAVDDAKQAEIDQENAVNLAEQKAADEVKRKEHTRILEETKKREAEEERAADKQHRRKINKEALDAIDKILARAPNPKLTPGQQIIIAISKGEVPNVSINY